METVAIALLLMGITGTFLGVIIALFARFFKTETDSRVELVQELLPGANCGGCGKAGCADFAKSVVAGENPPSRCPVSGAEQINAIALVLGISSSEEVRKRAVVRCGGDIMQTLSRSYYNGISDCNAASLVGGGPKGCRSGCLGLGSCANVCPFGAIEIVNNLALVHRELCVGCGRCVEVCPRKVIALVPADAEVHVYCNSREKGAAKRKQCKVACIGCGKCVRNAPEHFTLAENLASVNYGCDTLPGAELSEKIQCPTGALLSAREHHYIETHDPNWKKEEK